MQHSCLADPFKIIRPLKPEPRGPGEAFWFWNVLSRDGEVVDGTISLFCEFPSSLISAAQAGLTRNNAALKRYEPSLWLLICLARFWAAWLAAEDDSSFSLWENTESERRKGRLSFFFRSFKDKWPAVCFVNVCSVKHCKLNRQKQQTNYGGMGFRLFWEVEVGGQWLQIVIRAVFYYFLLLCQFKVGISIYTEQNVALSHSKSETSAAELQVIKRPWVWRSDRMTPTDIPLSRAALRGHDLTF